MKHSMHSLSGQKIIFLPGLDGTGCSFAPFGELLPADAEVRIISYPADKLLSFEETVCYVRDRIQGDSRSIVIAESFSGPVAAALLGSGQVKAKCLIFSATFARSPRPLLLKLLKLLPLEALIALPLPRFFLKQVIAGGERTTDIFIDLVKKARAVVPPKTLAHRLDIIDKVDVRRVLPKIEIPCLYLQAISDRTVPVWCLHDFTSALVDLKVARIQGPHFILQAQPKECLEAIVDFLAFVPAAAK